MKEKTGNTGLMGVEAALENEWNDLFREAGWMSTKPTGAFNSDVPVLNLYEPAKVYRRYFDDDEIPLDVVRIDEESRRCINFDEPIVYVFGYDRGYVMSGDRKVVFNIKTSFPISGNTFSSELDEVRKNLKLLAHSVTVGFFTE